MRFTESRCAHGHAKRVKPVAFDYITYKCLPSRDTRYYIYDIIRPHSFGPTRYYIIKMILLKLSIKFYPLFLFAPNLLLLLLFTFTKYQFISFFLSVSARLNFVIKIIHEIFDNNNNKVIRIT